MQPHNKEMVELMETKIEKITPLLKNETFNNDELQEITLFIDQAIMLLESFKKTETDTYKYLKNLIKEEFKLPVDIKTAMTKIKGMLEYIRTEYKHLFITQPHPISIEKENGSYWK